MDEPGSKEAEAAVADALKKGHVLHTADITLAEGLNALWKHAKFHKDIPADELELAVEDLAGLYNRMDPVPTGEVARESLRIAQGQNIAVYDALFVAAARKLDATLYTADIKMYAVATSEGIKVKLLKVKA